MLSINNLATLLQDLPKLIASKFDLKRSHVKKVIDSYRDKYIEENPSEDEEEDEEDLEISLPNACFMLLNIGIYIAEAFSIDCSEVNIYLNNICEDYCGVNPCIPYDKQEEKCLYIMERSNKGQQCTTKPRSGTLFCAKHINTQQAINYTANLSPTAQKVGKKLSQESTEKYKDINMVRIDKKWVVENFIIDSPKRKVVIGVKSKNGTIRKKLSLILQKKAEKMGLKII